MMLRDRLLLHFFLLRFALRVRVARWRHRQTVVMSVYDKGRIFWRVAEPRRLNDLLGK